MTTPISAVGMPAAPDGAPPPPEPRRFPIVATTLVAMAIAAMIALGVWQLGRREEKRVAIALYARNVSLPPIAFPRFPTDQRLLFRRAGGFCLDVVGWRIEGGRNAAGGVGWRQIAACRTGAEGPGLTVQAGMASAPDVKPRWRGGSVTGYIAYAPDHQPWVARLFSRSPRLLMLVADPPRAGLSANPQPDLAAIPNNHLAYAGQWFLFAAVAAIIYGIALRRRLRG